MVPATEDVIAISLFASQFNNDDLPTFGLPIIAIDIPLLILSIAFLSFMQVKISLAPL